MIVAAQNPTITWEKPPADWIPEEEPVDNTGQPLIAGALSEVLELAGYLGSERLVAGNLGICATLAGQLVIKAPDWFWASPVQPVSGDRRSYTPHLEGSVPAVVMEFLSDKDGGEYSAKPTYPPGKWFFYKQVLQVPFYVLFDSAGGTLEVYQLQQGRYQLLPPQANGRYPIPPLQLELGVWQGDKEGRQGYWLRWWNPEGELLLWGTERLEQERQRAEQERQRAEQEHQRAERLAEYLRRQGLDPGSLL
ncbi:MAG: Uma2 family endonuclease [Thermostichus sp. DG02_5_bins_236]